MSSNFAFLASTRGTDELKRMRLDIAAANNGNPRHIWVAEQAFPTASETEGVKPLEIVDLCLDAIRNSGRLLLVIDGSMGTRLTYEDTVLVSSYLEMELFQAVIDRVPIHIFTIGEIAGDSAAAKILRLFAEACPRSRWQRCASAIDAGRRIEQLRDGGGPRRAEVDIRAARQAAIAAFVETRFTDWSNERLGDEIEWLGGHYDESSTRPDPALVASLLNDPHAPARRTQSDLARAWLALRLLMGAPYRGPASEYDLLWDRALGQWASAVAWYGLHAHLDLGHVAALGSLNYVRRKLSETGRHSATAGHTASAYGALGSCYYSLAIQCNPRERSAQPKREVFMDRSTKYVDAAFAVRSICTPVSTP